MSIIKLQSSDGEIFDVEIEIAKASNTIKNMIEGEGYSYEYCSGCVYVYKGTTVRILASTTLPNIACVSLRTSYHQEPQYSAWTD